MVLIRISKKSDTQVDDHLVLYTRNPAMYILPLLVIKILTPFLDFGPNIQKFFSHSLNILLIAGFTHLALNLVFALRRIVSDNYNVDVEDNLRARKVTTQVGILVKIAVVIIIIISISASLMTFSGIRQIGVSLLASAGVTGIIIGLAAQKMLSNLLAGIQIAITQPIRIDDVLIVEGEWGRVEEITLTFVVVRIWDLRRLVLPISYFIDKPFQNWTRTSSDILGTVFLYTDYTVSVDAIRKEMEKIVAGSEDWDKKVCGVQVTDSKPDVLEIRLLISAKDASKAWNLRCLLREKIVDFIQRNYPESLPRTRAELIPQSQIMVTGSAKMEPK
ncbi:MAG: mechanosensitive ion channel [Fibrobacteria bacterium]|nr:mechanosensitive ion channel [Fibrobacteria bacterium]